MASGTFDIIHPGHGLYLEKAKELGGENAELVVVVAKDSTVKKRKRIPIINEKQRLEMVKYLKPVDEAYLGHDGDMFKIVEEIKPDIIAIGADQDFDLDKLRKSLKDRNLNIEVKKVKSYHKADLDSSCKIIKKIKETNYGKENLKDC
ncbi:MAG: FAD synthase [Methanobacteriaceae archaeon]|uniref:adenylyltransferase/cytidyltransferase family protein n=1 Tax=unclassified Methanobrevibacter TaxID=2638681 RepID=UPI002A10F4D3|nr:FAD synthase [Methanobacteriaceae archaeon]MDD3408951.1 FAD synthase [Methanobacteriaceae archaeon]MDD4594320.1 FAD synthase [Methanobacteriaceae archaeon]